MDNAELRLADGDPLADSEAIYPLTALDVSLGCSDPECACGGTSMLILYFEGGQVLHVTVPTDAAQVEVAQALARFWLDA